MTTKNRTRFATALALGLAMLAGCDNDIDPDTLVRDIRVLSLRVGSATPLSPAEAQAEVKPGPSGLDLVFTSDHLDLTANVAAPTGPGRRIMAPRPLVYEWYLCVGPASLFSPGTLDPGCRKWQPGDPDPMKSTSLRYLGSGANFSLPTAVLKDVVGGVLQILLTGGSGGGSGGTVTIPDKPISILLPLIMRVRAQNGDPNDIRDSEVGVTYLRTWIALPGMTLPPVNQNPALADLVASADKDGTKKPLLPCTATSCPRNPVKRGADLFLVGASLTGSIETYTPVDDTGRGARQEALRYSWFSTDGAYERERTGDTQPDNTWNSDNKRPPPDGIVQSSLWLVVQDERGGGDCARYELDLN